MALNLAPKTSTKGNNKKKDEATAPASFSIKLHQDWNEYKAGEYVSKPDHIAEIIRAIIANGDDETLAVRIKETKDEQIVAVAKTVDTKGMNAEEALSAIIVKVSEAQFMVRVEDVPTRDSIIMGGSSAAAAVSMGAKVDKDTVAMIEASILALRTADACAPLLQIRLSKLYSRAELSLVPPIMSRYRPHQARGESKAPPGYRAPDQSGDLPVWNGPWDLSEIHNTSGAGKEWPTTEWVADFTTSTPDGEPWFQRVECLRALDNNKDLPEGMPKHLRDEMVGNPEQFPAANGGLKGTGDVNKIKALLKEAAWEFGRRKNWYGKAFQIMQAIDKIESRFSNDNKQIKVHLFGVRNDKEDDVAATRRRNPYQLVTRQKNDAGEWDNVPHHAIPTGKLLTIYKLAHMFPPNTLGGTLENAKNKRQVTNKESKSDTAHAQGVDGMPPANTVDGAGKHLRTVVNYLDNEDNFTTLQRKAREDGDLASVLVRVKAALNNLMSRDPKAPNKLSAIEVIAQKYEDEANKAQASDAA